jgi:hypothetical protein
LAGGGVVMRIADYGRTIIVNYGVLTDLVRKVGAICTGAKYFHAVGLNDMPVDMRIVVDVTS